MENPTNQPPEARKCPACATSLPAGALAGLCPACLLKQGIAADTAAFAESAGFVPPPIADLAALFPQLEIIRLLGKGGMGAVYLARQPALDRLVALKILPAAKSHNAANAADATPPADPGFAERFTREARALARLSHPNIVAVHEFGQAGALRYFLMEYVDGVTLRQLQKTGRLSAHEALQIVPQLCDALQYAHDEGVVHRDIKPENVLVDRKGRVKIADFGLAKILGVNPGELRLTGEGQVMGTPHYMSPEQVEHPLEVDHRSDIYSLGVVFYEMLTGELPLGRFAPPSRKVQIDVRLDDVVLRALEKEPERRYQQVSEVKTRMQSISQTPAVISPAPEKTAAAEADQKISDALAQVKWPANALIGCGFFNLVFLFPVLFFFFLLQHDILAPGKYYVFVVLMFALLTGTLILIGGFKMKRLEGYRFALLASVLCCLFQPAICVGLPVGIWALVVLCRREVRVRFGSKIPSPLPAPNRKESGSKVAVMVCVTVLLILAIPALAILASIAIPAFAKARQRAQTIARQNRTAELHQQLLQENWTPPALNGEKPDPAKIYQAAKELMQKGDYEGALQRYLWYFHHALEYDPSLSGVRLSFIISDWVELGRRYPKARETLIALRDQETREFNQGTAYFEKFQEIASLNQYLQTENETVDLFKGLGEKDPTLAAQCFPIVESALVKKRDYALCLNYIGDPEAGFAAIRRNYEHQKNAEEWQAENAATLEKRREESDARLRKELPAFSGMPRTPVFTPPKFADKNFVAATRQLIEILVATQHDADAEKIRDEARGILEDPQIISAVTDAQAKLKH